MARSTAAPIPQPRRADADAESFALAEPIREGQGRDDPASLAATRLVLWRALPWLLLFAVFVLVLAYLRS